MSAEILRRAAALMRERFEREDVDDVAEAEFHLAVAEWLEVEASEWERFVVKAQAVNVLLTLADDAAEINARIGIGYDTQAQALAVARAYLGESA